MVQVYTPTNVMTLDIASAAFDLYNIDFYEMMGASWDFCYKRNYWIGIDKNSEGMRLDLSIRAIEDIDESLRNYGWILEKTSEIGDKDCYIGETIVGLDMEYLSSDIAPGLYYYIYDAVNCCLIIFSNEGKIILQKNASKENVCNMISHLGTVIFVLKKISDSEVCLNNMQEWCWKMKSTLVEHDGCRKIYHGLQGMKQLQQDLVRFSQHGNADWMLQWSSFVQKLLLNVAKIRMGNLSFLKNNCSQSELYLLFEAVALKWKEKFCTEEKYDLKKLSKVLFELIDEEEKVLNFLS